MNLPQLPTDKANHLFYGAVMFSAALFIAHLAAPGHQVAFASAFVIFMAVGKEASDALINWRSTGDPMHGPHGVEFYDALATCAGGALAALPLLIMNGIR
jgi:hypothetical protein